MDLPEFTRHAQERWAERCGDLHMPTEWATVRRCGRKTKRKVMARCPAHAHLMSDFRGFWYGISRHRVVFVVDQNQRMVTVFVLPAQPEAVRA